MSEGEYKTLRSALASTRMEGFEITKQTEQDCIRLVKGEISVSDLVKEIMNPPSKMNSLAEPQGIEITPAALY